MNHISFINLNALISHERGCIMLKIHKNLVLDESSKPIAVQIPIEEFEHLEEVIENFGLSTLMDEVQNDEQLSGKDAQHYYESLKK